MSDAIIELTPSEILVAAMCGAMRNIQSIKEGREPAYGIPPGQDWQYNIEGALGEAAVAKRLGIYWAGKGKLREPDVGIVDVRTSRKHNGDLILHKEDPDDRVFWKVTGENGRYVIRGWILASDGKKDEYWRDGTKGRPAYFVPHDFLEKN